MLTGDRLTEFQTRYWRRQACVFRNAVDISAYPIGINDVCELALSELVESRMINPDYELFFGPFERDIALPRWRLEYPLRRSKQPTGR